MNNKQKLNSIIKKIFGVAESEIKDDMSPKTVPNWDSMNFLMLVSEMEDSFNIKFTMNEVMAIRMLRDIKHHLESKGIKL